MHSSLIITSEPMESVLHAFRVIRSDHKHVPYGDMSTSYLVYLEVLTGLSILEILTSSPLGISILEILMGSLMAIPILEILTSSPMGILILNILMSSPILNIYLT